MRVSLWCLYRLGCWAQLRGSWEGGVLFIDGPIGLEMRDVRLWMEWKRMGTQATNINPQDIGRVMRAATKLGDPAYEELYDFVVERARGSVVWEAGCILNDSGLIVLGARRLLGSRSCWVDTVEVLGETGAAELREARAAWAKYKVEVERSRRVTWIEEKWPVLFRGEGVREDPSQGWGTSDSW